MEEVIARPTGQLVITLVAVKQIGTRPATQCAVASADGFSLTSAMFAPWLS